MDEKMDEKKRQAYQVGFSVLLLLGILTLGEYMLGAVAVNWWAPLLGVALIKAFFVVRDYMHVSRLFAGEEVDE